MFKALEELVDIIRKRKSSTEDKSYTKQLLSNKSLAEKKLKEEMEELISSMKDGTNQTHEAADLLYHLLVYLETNQIKIEDVISELKKRQQQSGLEEKQSRKK